MRLKSGIGGRRARGAGLKPAVEPAAVGFARKRREGLILLVT